MEYKSEGDVFFSKIILYGVVTNHQIRQSKSGKMSVKLCVNIKPKRSLDQSEAYEDDKGYILPEVEVVVEKPKLLDKQKIWCAVGKRVMLDCKFSFIFIRGGEDKIARKVQYISVEAIQCAGMDNLSNVRRVKDKEENKNI